MEIVRTRLNQPLNVFPAFRYNPDTGDVEVTTNGTTWNADAGADPRYNTAYQQYMAGKHSCGIAAGVVTQIEKWVATAVVSASLVTLMNKLMANGNELIPSDGVLSELYSYVAVVVQALGASAIEDAFTEDVLRRIKCILRQILNGGNAFTEPMVALAQQAVVEEFGDTVVSECFNLLVESWGQVGLTNAGWVNYDASADCDCDECNDNVTLNFNSGLGWQVSAIPWYGTLATWESSGGRTDNGGCVKGSPHASNQYRYIWIEIDLGQACHTFDVQWYARNAGTGQYPPENNVLLYDENHVLINQVANRNSPGNNQWTFQGYSFGSSNLQVRYVGIRQNAYQGDIYIDDVWVRRHL